MKVVIVEDEQLAAERLRELLNHYDPAIEVLASLESVEETVQYLSQHAHPDMMLLDISLSDGHSFEIFKRIHYAKPVIFTTAYNQYALDAFKMFSIDYILKPVTQEALATAFNKLKTFTSGFASPNLHELLPEWRRRDFKKRFLGKVGQRIHFIEVASIAFFSASNKIVHLADTEGNRYIVEYTMEALEEVLNPEDFFRASRGFIVNVAAIQQVKRYYNSRLKLVVKGASPQEEIIISRDRVPAFKCWAEEKKTAGTGNAKY